MPVTKEQYSEHLLKQGLNPGDFDLDSLVAEQNQKELQQQTIPAKQEVSSGEAFGRSFKRSIGPSLAGAAVGGLAAAPFTGGSSLLVPLLVGAGVGAGTTMAASVGQEKLLELSQGKEQYEKGLKELEAARTDAPIGSFLGELAPSLLTARPSLKDLKSLGGAIKNVGTAATISPAVKNLAKSSLLQAGVGGGLEAGMEAAQGQELSPSRIAGQALAGGLLTKPTLLGKTRAFGHREFTEQPTADSIKNEPTVEAPIVPKERQLTLPDRPLSSTDKPLVTPWEGSNLQKARDFTLARQEEVSNAASDLEGTLTGQQIQPVPPQKINPQKTSMKNVEKANKEVAEAPITEAEHIQDEYDRGIRHQGESQLAEDIKVYLFQSGRNKTDNLDIQATAADLATKRGVKRIVFDPNHQGAGEFNPNTGVVKLGPKAGLDTLFHEGVHALNKNILEGQTTPLQRKVLSNAIETLSKQAGVDAEEVLTEAAGLKGTKRLLDNADKNLVSQLKTFIGDVIAAGKARFGVNLKPEDVSRLLARWHTDNASVELPNDPVAFVAGRVKKEQEESKLKGARPLYVGGDVERPLDRAIGSEELATGSTPKIKNDMEGAFKIGQAIQDSDTVLEVPEQTIEQVTKSPYPALGENIPEVAKQQEESQLKPAKVSYKGYQEGFGKIPGMHLYNVEDNLSPTLPKGATVTEDTLKKAGFSVPEEVKPKANTAPDSELSYWKTELEKVKAEYEKLISNPIRNNVTQGRTQEQKIKLNQLSAQLKRIEGSIKYHEDKLKPKEQNQSLLTKLGNATASTFDRITLETKNTDKQHSGSYATKVLNKFTGLKSSLEGKYENGVREILSRYEDKVGQKVLDKLDAADVTDGQDLIPLSPEESKLDEELRKYLVDIHEEQRRRGITISGREAKDNPNYVPSILSREAMDVLTNQGTSAKAKEYKDIWAKYRVEQSAKTKKPETLQEANKVIEDYIRAINAKSETSQEFNAIRKAEGLGLPIELRDPNIVSRLSRYGRRVAQDFAWHDAIQSDPIARRILFQRDQNGQLPDPTEVLKVPGTEEEAQDLYSQKYVRDAVDLAKGRFNNVPDNVMKLSKVVTSAILGTGTGIRNIVSLGAQAVPYVEARDIGLVGKALGDMAADYGKAAKKAFLAGSYKDRINDIHFADNPDKVVTALDRAANFLRKYQGADLLEKVSRVYSHTLGEVLTIANFQRATQKDTKAIEFLRKFGTTVEGGVDSYLGKEPSQIPAETVARIAKEFVDTVQGSYDGRELPLAAINSPYAPFLTLSRWSIGRLNHVRRDVIQPLQKGDFLPFLKYTLGTVLTGTAIQQLNELLSHKKGTNPTVKESLAAGNTEELAYSVIALMQLGSFAGLAGDILKSAVDVRHGELPRGQFSFPLADFVSQTTQDLANVNAAVESGTVDKTQLGLQVVEKLLRNTIQSYRYLSNNTFKKEDTERGQQYRDLEVFKRLYDMPTRQLGNNTPNEFINKQEKDFKRETDINKALSQDLPAIMQKALKESNGDIEVLRRKLRGLKGNSLQTMPSPVEQPVAAKKYMDFLDRTVGQEERQRRVAEYFRQNMANRVKSRAVPSL